mmetsp:Transcript_4835/g.14690  ORF Transcript_4835/g.14690 Transcript_4835/m.14690 type:complete len:201 (-) Transcript_4835:305-907(-)
MLPVDWGRATSPLPPGAAPQPPAASSCGNELTDVHDVLRLGAGRRRRPLALSLLPRATLSGHPSWLFRHALMAYSLLSSKLNASLTCPKVPVPRCFTTTYFPLMSIIPPSLDTRSLPVVVVSVASSMQILALRAMNHRSSDALNSCSEARGSACCALSATPASSSSPDEVHEPLSRLPPDSAPRCRLNSRTHFMEQACRA